MQQRWFGVAIALAFIAALAILYVPTASAGNPTDAPNPALIENQVCLSCHSNKDLSMKLPSGETLSLYTDAAAFNPRCMANKDSAAPPATSTSKGYPHPITTARTVRDFSLQMYAVCRQCHEKVYQQQLDSMHAKVIAAGDKNAAVCTDCHTAHSYLIPIILARAFRKPAANVIAPSSISTKAVCMARHCSINPTRTCRRASIVTASIILPIRAPRHST